MASWEKLLVTYFIDKELASLIREEPCLERAEFREGNNPVIEKKNVQKTGIDNSQKEV